MHSLVNKKIDSLKQAQLKKADTENKANTNRNTINSLNFLNGSAFYAVPHYEEAEEWTDESESECVDLYSKLSTLNL